MVGLYFLIIRVINWTLSLISQKYHISYDFLAQLIRSLTQCYEDDREILLSSVVHLSFHTKAHLKLLWGLWVMFTLLPNRVVKDLKKSLIKCMIFYWWKLKKNPLLSLHHIGALRHTAALYFHRHKYAISRHLKNRGNSYKKCYR